MTTTQGQSDKILAIRQRATALPPLDLSLDDLIAAVAPQLLADKAKVDAAKAEKDRKAKEKSEIDSARRKAATVDACGLTPAEREGLRRRVLQWEVENQWEPVAFVALEQVDTCLCCQGVTPHLIGVYQHQRRKVKHQDQRFVLWTPEMASDTTTPRQLLTASREIRVCPRCAWQQGFVEQYPANGVDVFAAMVLAEARPSCNAPVFEEPKEEAS